MADNTRNQALLREMEERLNLKMEEHFMSIGASLKATAPRIISAI